MLNHNGHLHEDQLTGEPFSWFQADGTFTTHKKWEDLWHSQLVGLVGSPLRLDE